VISGSMNFLETSNGNSSVDYRGHNRNYGFTATINPRERYGFDFAYDCNDYQSNALICFNNTPPAERPLTWSAARRSAWTMLAIRC
jgi:hypothetical protein